jgi:hypothetical protein
MYMPIGIGVPLKITIEGELLGQTWNNVMWYTTDGAAFLTADATAVGQAYWNHIKVAWRAAMVDNPLYYRTLSVRVSEPGPTGAFGEYPIPALEQVGTRSVVGANPLPAFNAAGIRLAVATRTTRPGQKRIVGGLEVDQDVGVWNTGYLTLVNAIAPFFALPIVLGAPVATGALEPIVTRLSPAGDTVLAQQPVVGWVTNTYVTSQVSRKPGRGV